MSDRNSLAWKPSRTFSIEDAGLSSALSSLDSAHLTLGSIASKRAPSQSTRRFDSICVR